MYVKRSKKEVTNCFMLRTVWSRSIPYWEAMHRQKIAADQYKCQGCNKVYRLRDVQCDHIIPCVDTKVGWQGLAEFAKRLFVDSSGLQVLCKDVCHANKTKQENKERKEYGG